MLQLLTERCTFGCIYKLIYEYEDEMVLWNHLGLIYLNNMHIYLQLEQFSAWYSSPETIYLFVHITSQKERLNCIIYMQNFIFILIIGKVSVHAGLIYRIECCIKDCQILYGYI